MAYILAIILILAAIAIIWITVKVMNRKKNKPESDEDTYSRNNYRDAV